ncbi:MAG: hypothetical protein ACOC58_00975 [Chloroflexota bacterium]
MKDGHVVVTRVGEVVEASTAQFTAQCYELHQPPPFGSLVKIAEGDVHIYAVVSIATTTSIEPGRRPIARGADEEDEAGIYQSSPQLSKLLRTDFQAVVVGHEAAGDLHHYLPPRPARIHSFVYLCGAEEVARFTQSFDFLSHLLSVEWQADELVAAFVRRAGLAHEDCHAFLVKAGRELAVLLGGETNRLSTILRRLQA